MAQHNDTGKVGEAHAMRYLQNKGFQILETNYRAKHAEIDLIAQGDKLLIFVEVKTRTNVRYGNPETFVDQAKARLVMKAAEHYIFATDWQFDVRFDILAVTIYGDDVQVTHLEDAFY